MRVRVLFFGLLKDICGKAEDRLELAEGATARAVFDYYARQAAFHPAELGFPEPIYAWWGRQPFTGWAGPIVHKSDLESFATMVETRPQPGTVWLVLYELRYYDPHDSLRLQLSRKGHALELDYAGSKSDPEGRELPRLFAIR